MKFMDLTDSDRALASKLAEEMGVLNNSISKNKQLMKQSMLIVFNFRLSFFIHFFQLVVEFTSAKQIQ